MGLSEVELQNLRGEIAALEQAHAAGLSSPNLTARLAELKMRADGVEQKVDSNTVKDKQREQEAQAMALMKVEIDRYVNEGFKNKAELYDFAEKFKDEDFRAMIDGRSDEEKKKLAENIAKAYADMSPEEQKKFRENNPELMKWTEEQGYDLEAKSAEKSAALKKEFANLGNSEGVAAVERTEVSEVRFASLGREATREEKLEPIRDLRVANRAVENLANKEVGGEDVKIERSKGTDNSLLAIRAARRSLSPEQKDLIASQESLAQNAVQPNTLALVQGANIQVT